MAQPLLQTQKNVQAIIGLGANLSSEVGKPAESLKRAVELLARDVESVRLLKLSKFYATPCFPTGAGPDYVNAVAMIETNRSATDLLQHLHEIEAELGRERLTRWGARTLDLDLIDYAGEIHPNLETVQQWVDLPQDRQRVETPTELILPHPRMHERTFVLVPLVEIVPDWVHPMSGLKAHQLLTQCDQIEVAKVMPV